MELIGQIAEVLDLELHELVRTSEPGDPRDLALERLSQFASGLTAEEIQLVFDVGTSVVGFARRAGPGGHLLGRK